MIFVIFWIFALFFDFFGIFGIFEGSLIELGNWRSAEQTCCRQCSKMEGEKGGGFGRVWGEEIEDQSSGVQGEGSCRRSAAGERRAV